MRISESKIEEIRAAANIFDVISERVQLRKRGKNFIGLCPFHNEKTPSFTVSEEKQIFHCFGCHAGGNVFKFLMEYEKISFLEAVQDLADRLGINIELETPEDAGRQSEQEMLYDINSAAGRYFSDILLHSDEGEIARKYFENRKLKIKTIREFGLGYSLPGWNGFVDFAADKKIDIERAINLGLIGKGKEGRLYDKFSGRIIFPIFSPNGRVVAFAGRILEERDNAAKYLNSPESPVYVKGRVLYGLSHAKDEIRKLDKAIIVEGYMDLLSLYQNGIKNVVAVSGTALTEEQVQLLSRYTKNVVLLFDSDTAGIKASMRSIELLLKRDMEIKIVSLPEGEDPDSYVNKFGRRSFEELVDRSENFLEYQTRYYENAGMFKDASKTAEAVRELVKPLSLMNDELKRTILLKNIAQKFNLREKILETELQKHINLFEKRNIGEAKEIERKAEARSSQRERSKTSVAEIILEKKLITLLLEGEERIVYLFSSHLSPEDFEIDIHKKIAEAIFHSFEKDENITAGSVIEKLNDENIRNYMSQISIDTHSISKSWENINPGESRSKIVMKEAIGALMHFKINKIDREIAENTVRIAAASGEDVIEYLKADKELKELKKQIREDFSNMEMSH